MKKLIIGLVCVVALVGAGFGMAKFNAGKAEDYFTQEVGQITVLKQLPIPLTLENSSYDSGLFSSTARTRVMVQDQVVGMLKHDISHGMSPGVTVVTMIDTEDESSRQLVQAASDIFAIKDLKIVTVASLSGMANKVTIPSFGFEQRRSALNVSEMVLDVTTDFDFTSAKGKFVLASVDFKERDTALLMENLVVVFDSNKVDGVMLSDSEMSLDNFKIEDEGVVGMQFQNLTVTSEDEITDGLYGAESVLSAQNLTLLSKSFESVRAEVSLAKVDAVEFLQLVSDYQSLISNSSAQGEKLEKALIKMFAGSPLVALEKFEIVTPDGTISMTGDLGLVNAKDVEKAYDIEDIFEEYGTAHLKFESPKKALYSLMWALQALEKYGPEKLSESKQERVSRKVDQALESIKREGVLVEDGEMYTSVLSFSQGDVNINGKDPMAEYKVRAYNSAAQSDLRNAKTSCEAYYADYQRYPTDLAELKSIGYLTLSNGVNCEYAAAEDLQSYEISAYNERGSKIYSTSSTSYEITEQIR